MMSKFNEIYLGSKSPRRKELLNQIGVKHQPLLFDIEERVEINETALEYSKRITAQKLFHGWNIILTQGLELKPILCADTEVVCNNKILGKPNDYDEAFSMLQQYSNSSHTVITSVGLKFKDFDKVITNSTQVNFSYIPDEQIHYYLLSKDYIDKSGGYGIQSYFGQFITGINGCFFSVMGLPLNSVRMLLNELDQFI
jgi:septum formation protein